MMVVILSEAKEPFPDSDWKGKRSFTSLNFMREQVMKKVNPLSRPKMSPKYEPVPRSANSLHGEVTIIFCKKKGDARGEVRASL